MFAVFAPLRLSADELGSFKRLSIEELMGVEVFSASRRLEPTQTSPSAIFVLTNDDIRRSRVTSIPEALRLVPGVQVGRVDANKWAVSIRGFNSREANKLLVLIDGRSIYDQLFSGVLWESQDVMLEDIDRIEVIRGPGGTLWGANAFNGVINIITKNATETLGTLVSASAGDENLYTGVARFGWQPAENQSARVYAKALERDTGHMDALRPYDGSKMSRGGFRWDWNASDVDEIRVSGDVFAADTRTRESPVFTQDIEHRGHHVLAHWNHAFSPDNSVRVRSYYDRVSFESFAFDQDRHTCDLDLQQTIQLSAAHLVIWGGGYRRMSDRTESGFPGLVDVLPERRTDDMVNVFAQDTIALVPKRWHLTLGLKYEHNNYADAEWLPNLQLAWTPSDEQTWWATVSDAVRVPSRVEADLTFAGFIRIGDRVESEHVRAYGIGHRRLLSPQLWYDVAVFYNDYDDLNTIEQTGMLRNFMRGDTRGVELAVRWDPAPGWRVEATYGYLRMALTLEPNSTEQPSWPALFEGLVPRHQFNVRTGVDLLSNLELDVTTRYVDTLPSLDFPDYLELDVGLSWYPVRALELSLVGQNLLHAHHPEQAFVTSSSGMSTEVERSFYGKATWRF